ncbi:MAG: HD domain-containing protein, partial [Bacteroidales bacterium]|nr:HD domain-containing protein [Bacteroidales bacterium]
MPDIKEKLSFRERRQIYLRYKKLLQLSQSFLKEEDNQIIRQALDEAISHYQNEQLPSGEPFVLHLLDVARIVVEEIGMATKSVLASLLYDLVRRNKMSLNELDKKYGRKVREIVEGLLKIFDV